MTKRRASNEKLDEILRRPYTIEIEYGETPEEGVAAYVAEWPGSITAGATREGAGPRIRGGRGGWGAARAGGRQRGAAPPHEDGGARRPRAPPRPPPRRAQERQN